MSPLLVEIWSDIACPWCYVGKRRFEVALARSPWRESVAVRWRAFELDPFSPRVQDPTVTYSQRLARKYGTSIAQAEEMIRTMADAAAGEGLDFHFEKVRPGNTFDAHRVLQFAAGRGVGDAAQERLLRAYMSEGEPVGEREVLARLAAEIGLDTDEVRALLAGDAYAEEVRADEHEARERGIGGVPYYLIGRRRGLSGAQPTEVLSRALDEALRDPLST